MGARLSHRPRSSGGRSREAYVTRVCVIGESGTGKMSLADRFTKNQFDDETGEDAARAHPPYRWLWTSREVKLDGNIVNINVYINSERFETYSGLNGSGGVLVVYSVTDKYSFDKLSWWIDKVKCQCGNDIPIVLVGNKCDDVSKTVIDFPTAWDFAAEKNLPLVEVSAKDGTNVELAFVTLLSKIRLEKMKDWMLESVVE